ncbi:cardiolipin synthase [Vibrio cholerae]|nr:cardiolipin synthase [Vibrio cholerae]
MDKVYHFLTLLSIGIYWLLVAGVTIRVVLKRRAVSVSLAWLMVIYIIPFVGVLCYFLFGELNLGRKRAERAKEMFTPFGHWFRSLNDCQAHVQEGMGAHISRIDELCNNRMAYPHSVAIPYLYSTLQMKSCTPSLMILNAPSFKFVWCSTSGILVV